MNERHKLKLIVLGGTVLISIFFFWLLLQQGDAILTIAAALFFLSAWSCVQSVWWISSELTSGRIDENGNFTSGTAKVNVNFLHQLHSWSFIVGAILCIGALAARAMAG